jgi:hypothetical protein
MSARIDKSFFILKILTIWMVECYSEQAKKQIDAGKKLVNSFPIAASDCEDCLFQRHEFRRLILGSLRCLDP